MCVCVSIVKIKTEKKMQVQQIHMVVLNVPCGAAVGYVILHVIAFIITITRPTKKLFVFTQCFFLVMHIGGHG